MPCHDPLPSDHADARKARLDFLTKHLCSMLSDVERADKMVEFTLKYPELSRWYAQHKREDEMRERLERKRKNGEPLSQEETNFAWSAFS